jgi:gamma-glutamylcyclotransferase (GGCT)/AIG2-like uncharacterized protein YtfP
MWNGKLYLVNLVENYPEAVSSDNYSHIVCGGIYTLNNPDNILSSSDEYEKCSDKFPAPKRYRRIKDNINLLNGNIVKAWIYIYHWIIGGLTEIKSGNFSQIN